MRRGATRTSIAARLLPLETRRNQLLREHVSPRDYYQRSHAIGHEIAHETVHLLRDRAEAKPRCEVDSGPFADSARRWSEDGPTPSSRVSWSALDRRKSLSLRKQGTPERVWSRNLAPSSRILRFRRRVNEKKAFRDRFTDLLKVRALLLHKIRLWSKYC